MTDAATSPELSNRFVSLVEREEYAELQGWLEELGYGRVELDVELLRNYRHNLSRKGGNEPMLANY